MKSIAENFIAAAIAVVSVPMICLGAPLDQGRPVKEPDPLSDRWRCVDENACLRSSEGLARRNGSTLRIRGLNGHVVTFKDSSPDCLPNEEAKLPIECPHYTLAARVKAATPFFLVEEVTGDLKCHLVSVKTGRTIYSRTGKAAFSPDGTHLASFMSGNELATFFLDVLNIENNKAVLEFTNANDDDDGSGRSIEFKGWTSNDRIEFTYLESDSDERRLTGAAVRTGSRWKIVRQQP
jgi:hypothetical protein